jgi:hypothetical protein
MARIIVMPDADDLNDGISGTILYAQEVAPEELDDLYCSERILERLEGAVRDARPQSRPLEHAANGRAA